MPTCYINFRLPSRIALSGERSDRQPDLGHYILDYLFGLMQLFGKLSLSSRGIEGLAKGKLKFTKLVLYESKVRASNRSCLGGVLV